MIGISSVLGYLPYFIAAGCTIYYFNYRRRSRFPTESQHGINESSIIKESSSSETSIPLIEERNVSQIDGRTNSSANTSGFTQGSDVDGAHNQEPIGSDIADDLLSQMVGADEQTAQELYDNLSPELRARLAVQLEDLNDDSEGDIDDRAQHDYSGANPFLPDDYGQRQFAGAGQRENFGGHDVEDDDDIAGLTPEQINPRPQAGPSSSRNSNRIVGVKKTKSLARKDRIRAYNEYQRQQGEAERLAQKEFEDQYGDLIALAREDRQRREAQAQKSIKERQEQKRKEEHHHREQHNKIKLDIIKALESCGRMRLQDQDQLSVALTIPNATIVSDGSWIVRLTDTECGQIASDLKHKGKLTSTELSDFLSTL